MARAARRAVVPGALALLAVLAAARGLLRTAPAPAFASGLRGSVSRSAAATRVARAAAEGDELPSVVVDEGKPGEGVNVLELFKGKKGILFAVPGAFTPTCSEKHLPGYIDGAEDLKAAGAEVIACVSVNDPFVMAAWGKQQEAEGKVRMLADSKLELTKALDMELDATAKLGTVRSKRYAMLVDDGKIVRLGMDDDSFAPVMLEALKR
mmetsp:Transcript_141311/g.439182  ORF Transcript_141311/g.439182 Transcript_141311/m.439182 type:complete len:209 (+) Transcript_141311:38-664(+)|eukprot:CAMPEP_0204575506 /NCGR_PEP_ID=MMETSP0661-20131031/41236_1 /ASSEMBLY_ACC=CAM_ASM_000606 /TAXON_ID=109239 /ORGANISM="Alexandrium margalefi, Strain AMGDE01CS-322" /LENGTH=208 /DNA_ID=CAMNT_0051584147 /DNA_START=38 /DNA_END=664 /DNA_ORIENTATION=+